MNVLRQRSTNCFDLRGTTIVSVEIARTLLEINACWLWNGRQDINHVSNVIEGYNKRSRVYYRRGACCKSLSIQLTFIIPTPDTTTKFVILTIWLTRKPSLMGWLLIRNYAWTLLFYTSTNICFRYLLESPHRGDSNKYPKHMFYEEITIQHDICCISDLLIKDSLQQQIHFNGNIFGNKCCCCNEGSL